MIQNITRFYTTLIEIQNDNNRIQVLNSDGEFVTKWGTLGKGDGQFSGPGDIASDPSGEFIYVMDIDNNRVQKFHKNGEL